MSDSLYSPVPEGGNWRQNAVVGGYETDLTLADGFFDLAVMAFDTMAARPNDGLFVPAMYNARHAFELALKEGVRRLSRLLRERAEDNCQPVDPAWEIGAVNKRLGVEHRLHVLLLEVKALIATAGDIEALPDDVEEVIESLHDLDPSGQAFRYSKVKDKALGLVPARTGQTLASVVEVRERLAASFRLVASGLVGGEVGHLLDLQQEVRSIQESLGP